MVQTVPGNEPILAEVHCRTFRGRQLPGLLLALVVTMQAVALAAASGLPATLQVVLVLGVLALALGFLTGTSRYRLTATGIHREHRRFLGGQPKCEFAPFASLTAWKLESELSRSLEEYDYFELDRQRGARWVVTNRQDRPGFAAFRSALLARIAPGTATPADAVGEVPSPLPVPLPRRRGFYSSWFGKLVSLGFGVIALVMLVAALVGVLDGVAMLRLALVILPGTGYLLYRTFGPRRAG